MPPFVGRVSKAVVHRKPVSALGITGASTAPPVFTALPGTWQPTISVSRLPDAKWAVFQVSTPGQFSSDMLWQTVSAPAGNPPVWTFQPNATIKNVRDRLVVKSMDESVEWISEGAVVNLPPPAQPGGLAAAQAFVADLTVGMNIERAQAIWNGYITQGRCQYYRDLGITHLRFFVPAHPSNPNFIGIPQVDNGDIDWFFAACEAAMAVPGLKILVDLLDAMGVGDMQDGRVQPYLRRGARRIASRNWDVTKYALGAANEYGWDNNQAFQAVMHASIATLRAELPNSLLVCAGAMWNDPGALLGEKPYSSAPNQTPFVPPPGETRILVQWHKYDGSAHTADGANYWQPRLAQFTADTGLTTINGEWQRGPADGGGGIVGDQNYLMWPQVIVYALGMWQQRTTFWTVCGDPNTWWRANKPGTGELHDNVASAITQLDAAIRALPAWQATQAGGGGGGPDPGTGPSSDVVPRLQVLHTAQSNGYFADDVGATTMLRDTMASLTGLPVDMVSRKNTADDSTIHSGSFLYWDSPYNGDPRWLEPPGNNYGSDPSTWASQDAMTGILNAVSRHVSSDSSVPLLELWLKWEYDVKMEDAASKAAYANGSFEHTKRLRALRAKAGGKHVRFNAYCPYPAGPWNALEEIRRSWLADLSNASRAVAMAAGQMFDADDRGDGSHWTDDSPQRIYPRIAFRMARYCYEQGWLPGWADLSDCPSMGPRIVSAALSGNSVILTIAHDKGTNLVASASPLDWRAFTFAAGDTPDNGAVDAIGGAILDATRIRVDLPWSPPAGGRIWHAAMPWFRGRTMVRDNWHSIRPSKYASVPNIDVVEFPLQRTLSGVPY